MTTGEERTRRFRELHAPGRMLVLPNAWDAGSARLIESCGAEAIATTSSGVAWGLGYADGNVLPPRLLTDAVRRIARVIRVPLSIDAEAGYADEPLRVADTIRALVDAGAVGVNLEDGATHSPDVLCAKIAAVRRAAASMGTELFVNARTDVFLRNLVAPEARVEETLARAARYRDAGCDGIFVPGLVDPVAIGAIVSGTTLPVNVMAMPELPPLATLRGLGVRRVSAGAAIAQAAHGLTRRLVRAFLSDDGAPARFEGSVAYAELNALFTFA